MSLPKGSKSVNAISFSRDGNLIAAADFSRNNTIYCFDTQYGSLHFRSMTGENKILMIDWSLSSDTKFCTVGPKHLCFWNLDDMKGGIIKPKVGNFGSEEITNMVCVTHDTEGVAYTGG